MARLESWVRAVTGDVARVLAFARARRFEPRDLHWRKVRLLEAVRSSLDPGAQRLVPLARGYLEGGSSLTEVREARADAWSHLGSLACYCSVDVAAGWRSVLAVLETDASSHGPESIERFVTDLDALGIDIQALEREFASAGQETDSE